MFEVCLLDDAEKYIRGLTGKDRTLVEAALEDLERDPTWQNPNISPLVARFAGYYRYKKGDHRLVFKIAGKTVTVHVIGNRRDVYR